MTQPPHIPTNMPPQFTLVVVLTLCGVRGTPVPQSGVVGPSCPPRDSLCILQRMKEMGLINQQQYQMNHRHITRHQGSDGLGSGAGSENNRARTDPIGAENWHPQPRNPGQPSTGGAGLGATGARVAPETSTQRYRNNSKYNPDCWTEESPAPETRSKRTGISRSGDVFRRPGSRMSRRTGSRMSRRFGGKSRRSRGDGRSGERSELARSQTDLAPRRRRGRVDRSRRSREEERKGPCLWETSYYGEETI